MSIVKVIVGFARLRDDELDTRAQSIVEKMTGNASYPNPVPALADVTAAMTAYKQALVQAQHGGKDKTAMKNAKRFELEALLGELGAYVQLSCKNDLAMLLSSGFDARRPGAPIGELERPSNFRVENGANPGSVRLGVNSIYGADSYMFEYAPMPLTEATIWIARGVKARTHTIHGLTSGKQYAFRVSGIGTDRELAYSDVITRYIQ